MADPDTAPSEWTGPRTSPTYIETDWRCPRERYFQTEYEGVGLEPNRINEDLEVGRRIHTALECLGRPHLAGASAVAIPGDPEGPPGASSPLAAALSSLGDAPFTEPWQTWLEASIIAWATRVWPDLLKRYDLLHVEEAFTFIDRGVRYKVKPDLVLRDRRDGTIWILDFKTFSWWDLKKWTRAVQLQLGAEAVERATGLKVAGTIIQGISKGQVRGDKLYHPLVYGYRRDAEPGITKAAYSYGYKKGFERFPTHAYPGGVAAWVAAAPETTIADCVPQSGPIFKNGALMGSLLRQRGLRETHIHQVAHPNLRHATDLDAVFPQNFSSCESDRRRCAYFEMCHLDTVTKDPIGSGIYRLREVRR